MKARKISNRGTKKVIGKFPSLKLNKIVWWESQIERDYIFLLEIDPEVITYTEQPLRLQYQFKGKAHHYTPDFLVEKPNSTQIIEVKPEEKLTKEETLLLFQIVAPLFHEAGYEFVVVTDNMIRSQPKLDNIKLLWSPTSRRGSYQHFLSRNILRDGRHYRIGCNSLIRDREVDKRVCRRFFNSFRIIGSPQ